VDDRRTRGVSELQMTSANRVSASAAPMLIQQIDARAAPLTKTRKRLAEAPLVQREFCSAGSRPPASTSRTAVTPGKGLRFGCSGSPTETPGSVDRFGSPHFHGASS
jgi:hypothetical protein